MHPQAINKQLIAARAIVPCTMRVEGRLGKVLAPPEDSGRFYGRGKTGPNTDSVKIEYPKNSWFRPDKRAPAPPGDW